MRQLSEQFRVGMGSDIEPIQMALFLNQASTGLKSLGSIPTDTDIQTTSINLGQYLTPFT